MRTESQERYDAYLKGDHWRRTRRMRLQRGIWNGSNVMCQGCKMFVWKGAVCVHHKTYVRRGREQMSDLAILCMGCHAVLHGHEPPQWWSECRQRGELSSWNRKTVAELAAGYVKTGCLMDEAVDRALRIAVPVVHFRDVQLRTSFDLMQRWRTRHDVEPENWGATA